MVVDFWHRLGFEPVAFAILAKPTYLTIGVDFFGISIANMIDAYELDLDHILD